MFKSYSYGSCYTVKVVLLMIYEKWGNMKYKYRNREFWCRGYYVDTVSKNEIAIKKYIEGQLKEDMMSEQLTIDKINPFTGSKK